INAFTQSHRDFHRLQLAHIFPNVKYVDWRHYIGTCVDCGYVTARQKNVDHNPTVQECMRLARQPLKLFTALRAATLNLHPIKWRQPSTFSIDELTEFL